MREVFYRDQQMTNARIKELESLSMFFKPIMPLCQAMMFNTELTARPSTAADLAQWLDDPARVQVFEATETIDGRNCLLLGSSATQIYLDMDRTFALVRVDTYRLERNEAPDTHGLSTIKGRWLKGRRTASDFQDYGNGIWLPNRTELVHFDKDGKILAEKTTRVQNMEINPILDDGFFSEIIPEDAFVVDGVRNMTYVYGERASIGGLLRDTVPSKTTTRLRWISVCAGLVLIVLVISMTIRKAHMRRKGI
ncbi:MAG: hypothetical protein HQ582_33805 [Planctomycetes bacterium]|nr:hypothetical protein [Planctomycetota bacterium]